MYLIVFLFLHEASSFRKLSNPVKTRQTSEHFKCMAALQFLSSVLGQICDFFVPQEHELKFKYCLDAQFRPTGVKMLPPAQTISALCQEEASSVD